MKILGLYHLIGTKRASAGAEARATRRPECDPRIAHEKGVTAEKLALEAEDMADHARANEEVMENLNQVLHYLGTSKHQSRYRKLCITDLESSINWLHRENGDPQPEVQLEVVETPAPINGKKKI